jgi:hypothetical protein
MMSGSFLLAQASLCFLSVVVVAQQIPQFPNFVVSQSSPSIILSRGCTFQNPGPAQPANNADAKAGVQLGLCEIACNNTLTDCSHFTFLSTANDGNRCFVQTLTADPGVTTRGQAVEDPDLNKICGLFVVVLILDVRV